jgi:hypothetical protein
LGASGFWQSTGNRFAAASRTSGACISRGAAISMASSSHSASIASALAKVRGIANSLARRAAFSPEGSATATTRA